jgi:hypothetical protein
MNSQTDCRKQYIKNNSKYKSTTTKSNNSTKPSRGYGHNSTFSTINTKTSTQNWARNSSNSTRPAPESKICKTHSPRPGRVEKPREMSDRPQAKCSNCVPNYSAIRSNPTAYVKNKWPEKEISSSYRNSWIRYKPMSRNNRSAYSPSTLSWPARNKKKQNAKIKL